MEQNFNSDYSNDYPLEENEKISMFDAWVDALTSPNKETYEELGNAKNASLLNGAVWVLLATIVGGIVSSLLSLVFGTPEFAQLNDLLAESGTELPTAQIGASALLMGLVCGVPISAISAAIGFAISTVIENWIANLFGGKGSLDSYAFVNASFYAPLTMVSSMLSPVPIIGPMFVLLFGLYSMFLSFVALRGVKQLSTGKAILVMLVPVIIVVLLFGCIMLVFGASLASYMQNYG